MSQITSLLIPKRDRKKGQYIFCSGCNRTVTEKCGKSGKRLSACKTPHLQKFQTRITINGRTRPFPGSTMSADLRDYKEYDRIHAELIKGGAKVVSITTDRPMNFKDCLQMYNDDMNDIGRESYEAHNYSKDWIQKTFNRSKTILSIFEDAGINPKFISVSDFKKEYVGLIYEELSYKYQPKTLNHFISLMNNLFSTFLIEYKNYQIKNPFADVNYLAADERTEIVELDWFNKLIEVTIPKNGSRKQSGRTRNMYKPEVIDFWKLMLYTGRRPQDIPYLKVENILDTYGYCFEQKTRRSNKNLRLFIVSEELREFKSQQIEKYKLKEKDYLIWPDKENREAIKTFCTFAWTHFWTFTKLPHRICYDLRNTYATHARMVYGSEMEGLFKLHAKVKTTDEKYTNAKVAAERYAGMKLFG